jgi:uncharacterized protein YdaU (DUF1376 family)
MPFGLIALHPKAAWLPQAAFGMLTRLAWYYWSTEKPLPRSDAAINALLAVHRPTWSAHKAEIWAIRADVVPQLDKEKKRKRAVNEQLATMRQTVTCNQRARRLNEAHKRSAEISAPAIALPERTQTQTRINVERRTKRLGENTFFEKHF